MGASLELRRGSVLVCYQVEFFYAVRVSILRAINALITSLNSVRIIGRKQNNCTFAELRFGKHAGDKY